jgi:hypothetical protein
MPTRASATTWLSSAGPHLFTASTIPQGFAVLFSQKILLVNLIFFFVFYPATWIMWPRFTMRVLATELGTTMPQARTIMLSSHPSKINIAQYSNTHHVILFHVSVMLP